MQQDSFLKKAFVFGKFLPFHKGHEAMIRFALAQCDFLTVLVCCSDKETIPSSVREGWIKETFGPRVNLEVKTFHYQETELPNTSVASREVSKVWADAFKSLFAEYSLVITSEPYGEFVAEFMGINHLLFDVEKKQYPISATAIRKDVFSNWKFLPDSVKPFYTKKATVLGTESTGKTTLTERLAKHFGATSVKEAGREIITNSNRFSFEDLQKVAEEHARRIEAAVRGDSPLVIIDTDVHITMSYARFVFKKELKVSESVYKSNQSDFCFYLNNDVPYVQDGSRLCEADRNLLDFSHREVLQMYGTEIIEISGNWEQRFEKAVAFLEKEILKK